MIRSNSYVEFGSLVQKVSKGVQTIFENTWVVELEDIEKESGRLLNQRFESEISSTKSVFTSEDILYSKLRPYLKKYVLPYSNGICTSELWVLRPNKKISREYLFYLIQSPFFNRLTSVSSGSKMPRANWKYVKQSEVPLHSDENERLKICRIFNQIDQKINLLTKKKEALETYKKGLMQKIFSQELRFKREDGTDYPEWEENEIGQIFKEIRDKVGDSVVETFSITAGKGFVSQAEKFGRDISGSQNPNYIRLKPNQYSYNKGNSKTFKYGCVYRNLIGKDIAVPNVFISLDLLNGDYRYFDALFESHLLDRHLRRIISSSARMDGLLNIPKRDFFLISLPVPCLEEQAKIGQSMHQLNKSIGVIERQLQNVISLKKGLLQQMFV